MEHMPNIVVAVTGERDVDPMPTRSPSPQSDASSREGRCSLREPCRKRWPHRSMTMEWSSCRMLQIGARWRCAARVWQAWSTR